ncbi:MAG: sigma-54-dependent Fis family transcriptional regulator [Planctomycetales bacterium]|nr:sigma-54-dependent Fis family transcriptional regulator [Planctomycetales bacterium]
MYQLFVIDGDEETQHSFAACFRKNSNVKLHVFRTGASALAKLSTVLPDAVFLSVQLQDMPGLEAFEQIIKVDRHIPVVLMTAGDSSGTAIRAIQRGALDYLSKPLDFQEVLWLAERAFEIRRLTAEGTTSAALPTSPGMDERDVIIGRSPAMQKAYRSIGRVASQNLTVLIRGESGTGKELVARALYQHSRRNTGPFLAVNCAAIPEALLESELFGHEKGAFTGADRRRIGKFEQCTGGTLFLDEIGDMPPQLQAKLLRILQEQRFERVGGEETIQTDVRVIAATSRDMERMVAKGEFRGDLYYRLNGYAISLPPLRDRGADLELLTQYFLMSANRDLGKSVDRLAPEAVAILHSYPWPGNIRELQSVIRQAVLDTTGPVLFADALPEVVRRPPPVSVEETQAISVSQEFIYQRINQGTNQLYDELVAMLEQKLISDVLRATGANQGEAARILGVTRTTLRTKIKKLGISIASTVSDQISEWNSTEIN